MNANVIASLKPMPSKRAAHARVARDARIGRRRRLLDRRERRRQVLEAVMPADFFDQIDRPLHVDAPAGHRHLPDRRPMWPTGIAASGCAACQPPSVFTVEAEARRMRSASSSGTSIPSSDSIDRRDRASARAARAAADSSRPSGHVA